MTPWVLSRLLGTLWTVTTLVPDIHVALRLGFTSFLRRLYVLLFHPRSVRDRPGDVDESDVVFVPAVPSEQRTFVDQDKVHFENNDVDGEHGPA